MYFSLISFVFNRINILRSHSRVKISELDITLYIFNNINDLHETFGEMCYLMPFNIDKIKEKKIKQQELVGLSPTVCD